MVETKYRTFYEQTDGKTLQIIKQGVLNLQVCTNMNEEDTEQAVNDIYPCGTTAGWVLSKREEVKPVECGEKKGFIHYILDC